MEGELLGQLQELHRQLAEVRAGGREGGGEEGIALSREAPRDQTEMGKEEQKWDCR